MRGPTGKDFRLGEVEVRLDHWVEPAIATTRYMDKHSHGTKRGACPVNAGLCRNSSQGEGERVYLRALGTLYGAAYTQAACTLPGAAPQAMINHNRQYVKMCTSVPAKLPTWEVEVAQCVCWQKLGTSAVALPADRL